MAYFFGLGKQRSKFGKWLDERGISQTDIVDKSGLSRETISNLASDDGIRPTQRTRRKVMDALRQYDPNINSHDFWT